MAIQTPPPPKKPAGFGGPAVEGADNMLDPATRGALRGAVREAVSDALHQIASDLISKALGGMPAQSQSTAEETGDKQEAPAKQQPASPAKAGNNGGAFAHGDLDLSHLSANVAPPEERKPQRSAAGRRFYFLPD